MRVVECPNCRKKDGFLAFRTVKYRNQKYPYICHYDPSRYQEQKKNYILGKRKSKPTGRRCCSISLFDSTKLDFSEEWFKDYLELIKKIHTNFLRFGFMSFEELKELCKGVPEMFKLEKTREEFIKNPHWQNEWKHSQLLLEKAGYSKDLAKKKIRDDIFFRFELSRVKINDFKHQFLYTVFLD